MASKLGAKVYNYPYESFSYKDAKNFAIDMLQETGYYLLILMKLFLVIMVRN
ncbi:MAG TPA: hypothetical protein GXX15_13075 [Clostridia bacterium]|nr:hypothetical protein [Clostridia bacterium]